MSNLADLQQRVSTAFGGSESRVRGVSIGDEWLNSAGLSWTSSADDVEGKANRASRAFDRARTMWLGGGGLAAGALLFVVGYAGGALALAGLLIAFAIFIMATKFYSRVPFAGSARASLAHAMSSEREHDRLWERDENASLFATIHDALGDIALTRTLDRRIIQANATFRSLTGKHRPEGMTCEEIGLAFRPVDEPQRFDVEISTPTGQRIFAWHDVAVRDPASGQLLVQSIARDVTDERLAARAREEARMKAEYNSAAKSRLLATVSHEIRTPLSGILGMSHLISQTKLTAEQANYLTGMRQSGNALVQLVEDLLDFSTIEVGRFELRPRAESLRQLIESVVEMLSHRAHEKGIEIGATVSADVPELMNFDPARLRQVLFNVIGNAVKFTQTGGVLISARVDGDNLVIAIRDSGPGMTAEEQARIFGEFEQAGSQLEKSGGTGLGLTISARIMHEFGGSLSVSSKKGAGSEFTVRFPINLPADSRERGGRTGLLKGVRDLLLAPDGPASVAIAATIRTLGGDCRLLEPEDATGITLDSVCHDGPPPTDIIVDHRMAPQFFRELSDRISINAPGVRKIFLVNPEERSTRPLDLFDAWLIRPLREQSLIDVLRGRMRGMEKRDAINDNQPGFGPAVSEAAIVEGLTIVLAEDDPVNAMLVRAMLTKAGHKVQSVDDFQSLLDRSCSLGGSRPDLVVTDLSMPGGEGLDVLERIRAHERDHDLAPMPIVVLTADNRDETRRHALLSGADSVLAKPVDPERLTAEVQTLATQALKLADGQ